MKILTILGSSRENGNSEYLVEQATEGIEHTQVRLSDYKINPIIDMRHTDEGFSPVEDDYETLLHEFLAHDLVIFVTPIYWFGMTSHMKLFFDRWSQYMRDDRFNFKEQVRGKKAYVITTGGSNPYVTGLPLIQQFGHIFDFVGMSFEDYVIGNAVKPGEINHDRLALDKMKSWNQSFKN